jgi:hypothetical protein
VSLLVIWSLVGRGGISWSRGVSGSRVDWSSSGRSLISWSRVNVRTGGRIGGWDVRVWFVLGILGLSNVFNISNIAIAISFVSNGLSAAVREDDTVSSGGYFSIAALRMRIIVAGRMGIVVIGPIVFNSPFKVVGLSNLWNKVIHWLI